MSDSMDEQWENYSGRQYDALDDELFTPPKELVEGLRQSAAGEVVDLGDFTQYLGEAEKVQAQLDALDVVEPKLTIFVLSAFWYGLTSKGQPVTLGTFTTELKAQEFLDKFREADTGHAQYGDYNIFEERLDPTY